MQNLARYPLDSQSCALRILSYAYDTDEIVIKWNGPDPIDVNPEIRMPDMRLRSIHPSIRNDTYATGIWSCALADFHVDREIMHHIIQSYLPTALIVVISWFSFWLDVEAVPGRVSLSITTLLTLATQSSAARMALPQKKQLREMNQTPVLMRQNFLSNRKRKAIEERMNRVEENRKYAQSIDRRSRVYFPLAFISFNVIYWIYYIKYAVDTID
ncbi:Neurotransmitter-gated ion-channel transmembrane region [Necator americanus]|uniref:Neurotransmitter-gated ion-channel transmembrane region n=1 Tax=Necator americanus TaxID=51031 RepID=W2T6G8_NECAM|nr:Neurotransmitter-gated ion-channel transmembrane region [Necator americanus]ETN77224.1 Neurotransmitter-gated ion-channel transmembrane region [Necator americanus]